jgi:hypothetical protein
MRKLLIFFSLLFLNFQFCYASGRCTGSENCEACETCNYCKHCAGRGGTCGVCGGGDEEIEENTISYPNTPEPIGERRGIYSNPQNSDRKPDEINLTTLLLIIIVLLLVVSIFRGSKK